MKKMSTLYKKDPNDLSRVIDEVAPENAWVFECGIPTRKFDGSATAIICGELYKRYDCKKGKIPPEAAIPCDDPDPVTGHWPHWVKCARDNPNDKYAFLAFDALAEKTDGTYELCGEKVQGNPEHIQGFELVRHGREVLEVPNLSFNGLRAYFENPSLDIEGIVFHAADGSGRMCKIRKCDFGIRR
jgi:hypothetical protein